MNRSHGGDQPTKNHNDNVKQQTVGAPGGRHQDLKVSKSLVFELGVGRVSNEVYQCWRSFTFFP